MKLGNECEGRLKCLYTLFMTAKEAKVFFTYKSLKDRALRLEDKSLIDKVKHIYISDLDNEMLVSDDCLARWDELEFLVTIEVTHVKYRDSYPFNVTLMLNLTEASARGLATSQSFWQLKETDQIKFHQPYGKSFYVCCVTKENMTKTCPSDFGSDIEFTASTSKKFLIDSGGSK